MTLVGSTRREEEKLWGSGWGGRVLVYEGLKWLRHRGCIRLDGGAEWSGVGVWCSVSWDFGLMERERSLSHTYRVLCGAIHVERERETERGGEWAKRVKSAFWLCGSVQSRRSVMEWLVSGSSEEGFEPHIPVILLSFAIYSFRLTSALDKKNSIIIIREEKYI